MKIQNLSHGASFLSLILGLLVLASGFHIVESNAFGAWIVSVLFGVPLILIGGLIVIGILTVWIPHILIQSFGAYVGISILAGLLLTAYLLHELKPAFFYEPIYVGVIEGAVYDDSGFNSNKLKDLMPDENVGILEKTIQTNDGFPWFWVTYDSNNSRGYMWGGELCAKADQVEGVNGVCKSYAVAQEVELQKRNEEWQQREKDRIAKNEQRKLDILEKNKLISGKWENANSSGLIAFFEEGGRYFEEHNSIVATEGSWQINKNEEHFVLTLRHKNGSSNVRIYTLNAEQLIYEFCDPGSCRNSYPPKIIFNRIMDVSNTNKTE